MNKIRIEVAYASQQEQKLISLSVPAGTTIAAAIEQSGIVDLFPEIDMTKNKVGVFSQMRSLDELVNDGDRIEIYRPLIIDPKEARRAKAKKA